MTGYKYFEGYQEFRKYLNEIESATKKPFSCPLLVVLPEQVKYGYGDSAEIFEAGALICKARVGSVLGADTIRCNFHGEIILDDNRCTTARCGWNGSQFIVAILGFQPKKKKI